MNLRYYITVSILAIIFLDSCSQKDQPPVSLLDLLSNSEYKPGKSGYLGTPYVTAGDRVYMVGNQDGSFPDLGWHVQGEMGGIWDHPIKLMDGFGLNIKVGEKEWCIDKAEQFINYPYANQHNYNLGDLGVKRVQFVPDGREGLIVEYSLINNTPYDVITEIQFTGYVELTPVWLSEKLDWIDGHDQVSWDQDNQTFIAKDENNDWFTVFGTNLKIGDHSKGDSKCIIERKGKGIDASISSEVIILASQEIQFQYYISGSYHSDLEAKKTYENLKFNAGKLLQEKIDRYSRQSARAAIDIPDKDIQDMYNWVRYNTDWLMREVPEQGRALSAGLPDYPWWFGADNAYSIQGMLSSGLTHDAISTIDLVLKLSQKENGNGRIMHETSTNGVVYNPGNLNETPHFIYVLWETYEWTGDKAFLERVYPIVKEGLKWMEEQDKDKNGFPDGPGMMEIQGLHSEMIDVVVYMQKAYLAASNMAKELGDQDNADLYSSKAKKLKEQINSDWWVEEASSFADFRSTTEDALKLIDAAMIRADTIKKPWTVEELKKLKAEVAGYSSKGTRGFVVHHNWVVNTPMEMGIADPDKAIEALNTAEKYASKYGMYVTGIDRVEGVEESSKWKQFSYVGAVMTLPTGVEAIGEGNYGRPDKALSYLKMLHNSFGYALPGSLYEVSPDYGMFTQAWTIYAVAYPIINQFFGVKPMAHKKRVIIRPSMPSGWENASLSNLPVGNNSISISKKRNTWEIAQREEGWTLVLEVPEREGEVIVNGESVSPVSLEGFYIIELADLENTVVLE